MNALSSGDTAWVLVSAALVLAMVPGLALFYGGLVRNRSVLNTMMMTGGALAVVGVQWVVVGYSLAFEPGSGGLGGLGWMGLAGVGAAPEPAYGATIPHLAFAAFQAMFAGITAALIAGAVVERMRFPAFLLFALLWTTLVYDPVAHWVWAEGGWLRSLGALDFAGGTVVHVTAGVSALVAAILLGRRRDFGTEPLLPHSVPLTLLGAGLLWFGWFGFNAGSALAADGIAANAFATTFTAGAAATCGWIVLELVRSGRATAVGAATGLVVGLVGITPAAGFVTPLAALVIGAGAAVASHGVMQLRGRSRIDDSLDVFACHGVAGIVGAMLTGVFATTAVNPGGADGWLAGNPGQMVAQLAAVAAAAALAVVGTGGAIVLLRAVMRIRVDEADEVGGVDLCEHGEQAYGGEALGAVAGRSPALADSVFIPATEAPPGQEPLWAMGG